MVRAIESARIWTPTLDAATLAAGLRHNISEELGGLAERVEVTQSWDDLVLAPDTLGQVHTLIARVRHKYQVLESWGYRSKIARGTGVPACHCGVGVPGSTAANLQRRPGRALHRGPCCPARRVATGAQHRRAVEARGRPSTATLRMLTLNP